MPWQTRREMTSYRCTACGAGRTVGASLSSGSQTCPQCGQQMMRELPRCAHLNVRPMLKAEKGQCKDCAQVVLWSL